MTYVILRNRFSRTLLPPPPHSNVANTHANTYIGGEHPIGGRSGDTLSRNVGGAQSGRFDLKIV